MRLGDDEARGVEDPADGRGRRDGQGLAPEVPGDRGRPGVEPARGELDPQGGDPVPHRVRHGLGAAARPARPGLQAVEPVLPVPAQQPVEVAPTDAALGGRDGDGQLT